MKNEKYWKKRQEEKLSSILNDAQVASEYVSDIYSKASLYTQSKINGIFEKYRDGHGLSNADAKEMLDSLISDRDYNQIKRILENNPKTKQRKELLKKLDTPPYQYRIKRLENMQSQLDKLMNEVYKVEKDVSTDCYINSAFNAYYRNVYNLQKGMKVAYQFDMLDPELIDSMLKSRWSGKNYSNRIWDNTNALAESLKDEMLMGVLTNKTEKEMADTIMNKFAVGAYQARRLIQTESAAMTAFADQQAFKDAGIEKEMFIAVHDSRTSQICQHHDRSIVEIAKAKVGVNVPPLHPNCRSHMIPYIEGVTDAMKKRQRNPVTNKDEVVDVSENYDQWLKRQQEEHGVDTVNSFMEKTKNASSDRKQYNKYIDVLGKENMPTSLSKFQDMKYNDVEKFNDLKLHFKDSKLQKGITESYNLTLREGQQGKHILGHNNYLEGRSYIVDASKKDIQECIKKHAGNGTINRYRNGDWDNTESIVDNSIVGYVLSIDKTWIATNKFKIHYSKEKGTHMVPTLKGVKKND